MCMLKVERERARKEEQRAAVRWWKLLQNHNFFSWLIFRARNRGVQIIIVNVVDSLALLRYFKATKVTSSEQLGQRFSENCLGANILSKILYLPAYHALSFCLPLGEKSNCPEILLAQDILIRSSLLPNNGLNSLFCKYNSYYFYQDL